MGVGSGGRNLGGRSEHQLDGGRSGRSRRLRNGRTTTPAARTGRRRNWKPAAAASAQPPSLTSQFVTNAAPGKELRPGIGGSSLLHRTHRRQHKLHHTRRRSEQGTVCAAATTPAWSTMASPFARRWRRGRSHPKGRGSCAGFPPRVGNRSAHAGNHAEEQRRPPTLPGRSHVAAGMAQSYWGAAARADPTASSGSAPLRRQWSVRAGGRANHVFLFENGRPPLAVGQVGGAATRSIRRRSAHVARLGKRIRGGVGRTGFAPFVLRLCCLCGCEVWLPVGLPSWFGGDGPAAPSGLFPFPCFVWCSPRLGRWLSSSLFVTVSVIPRTAQGNGIVHLRSLCACACRTYLDGSRQHYA